MPAVLEYLIESYRAGTITRREFMQKALLITGSLAVAQASLYSFGLPSAYGAQVDPDDPALTSADVKFASTDGAVIGSYLTSPKGDVARPAVMVIHAWDGINDHTRDVARRLAKAGYVALAPDLLSREGGTSSFASREAAIAAGRKLDNEMIVRDLNGGINYLKGHRFVGANKIGVIGFCWGGGKALLFTTRSKDLAASVIYYGTNPSKLEDVKNITAPVLGHYGEEDERITSEVPKLDEAMKRYGKSFAYKVYPGAPHGFNSDTSPQNYREDAAKEAWARTLEFFKKHLQG